MISRRALFSWPLLSLLPEIPTERRIASIPKLPETRIVFGGDVMLSRYVGILAKQNQDPAWPFRAIAPYFSTADIAFVNLEAPFLNKGRVVKDGMVFRSEPEMIAGLDLAGIDVVSLANNHIRDCGSKGIEYTLAWLAQHKIAAAGAAASSEEAHSGIVLERNGTRFGFLAYTFDQSNGNHRDSDDRVAMLDPARMADDVRSIRERCDVAIVSMHAGYEYQPKPNAQQKQFGRAAIDAGAKLVIGHHPHVVQPVEPYRGGVICYSLGNLVFDQFQRAETQRGLVMETIFEGKRLIVTRFLPVVIGRTVPRFIE